MAYCAELATSEASVVCAVTMSFNNNFPARVEPLKALYTTGGPEACGCCYSADR